MPCSKNITANIVNSCRPVKGFKPIGYWAYRSDINLTITDNTITFVSGAPLGRFEMSKFGLNAGHDVVATEGQELRFKHKFETVFNDHSIAVDELDDIVVFLQPTNSTAWQCFGAQFGLWKASQSAMRNDNMGTIAVSMESMADVEEPYSVYNCTVDVSLLPNMSTFDLIYGGTIANAASVKLTIDSDKTGYVLLPNSSLLTTSAGVINTINTGVGGRIAYYVPKVLASNLNFAVSGLMGRIIYNGDVAASFYGGFNPTDSVTATFQKFIDVRNCGGLTELIAPKAVTINAIACALTAKSMGDILYSAYNDNRLSVNYNFSGGTNANGAAIEAYLLATYGIALYTTIFGRLVTSNGGTILLN